MDPDVAEHASRSIQEYSQHNSVVVGSRVSQGIKYGRGQISSTTMYSIFAERRSQLAHSFNEE